MSTRSAKSSQQTSRRSIGFFAGVIFTGIAFANLAITIADFALGHPDHPLIVKAADFIRGRSETVGDRKIVDHFKAPVFLSIFWSKDKIQTWKLTLHGDETITGEMTDIAKGGSGTVSGNLRHGVLVGHYVSTDPDRPGRGTFTLRAQLPRDPSDETIYSGQAQVHDCGCTPDNVRFNGPTMEVDAILGNHIHPSDDALERFFHSGPRMIDDGASSKA